MNQNHLSYIPALIAAYKAGFATDHAHLGYWDQGATYDWEQAQSAMTGLHLDALDLRNGDTVIDIGCGLGGSLRLADERLSQADLIGVNIDPRQLEICRSLKPKHNNNLQWVQCDATDVSLSDDTADRVLSLEAMFHFPERRAFFDEAARLLRSDGVLVCSNIQFLPSDTSHSSRLLEIVTEGYAPWPAPVVRSEQVIGMGQESGLELVSAQDLTSAITRTWDHIVPCDAPPDSSPVAAMRALHLAGLMNYVLYVFKNSAQ